MSAIQPDDYPVAHLDTNWFGNATKFIYSVPFNLVGKLHQGDLVWVTDDDVLPYLCRIHQLLDDGKSAEYHVVSPGSDATHGPDWALAQEATDEIVAEAGGISLEDRNWARQTMELAPADLPTQPS